MNSILTESPLGFNPSPATSVRTQFGCSEIAPLIPVVFVVDGHQAVCESLAPLINREGWRPETFTSAEEFLCRPLNLVPSCLILEVSLPGLSGLELQRRVATERPDVPIIFLSAECDVPTTVQAMKAGAAEFFMKPFREAELVSAIRKALELSRVALDREAEKRLLQRYYASLSRRERQVMALVSSGLSNKEVGNELGISEITVKTHRGQMMQKMLAGSLADLVKKATKLGLAKRLEMPMLRREVGRAPNTVGQPLGSYASATGTLNPGQVRVSKNRIGGFTR